MRPRKNLEREINGRRVERVHGVFQINSKRVTRIKAPRLDDQGVGKITVNLPVAFLVGIGQIAARDVTANAEMVKFGLVRAQANFDVTQALAEGQLREGHAQILIQMGERFCGVTGNARRSDEMCATEENPSVARKQVCRRTLGITKAEKPQSPKSKFKSVTPRKSFFLFATSDLPPAINKIAGQQ